jgi:hypothetical protein
MPYYIENFISHGNDINSSDTTFYFLSKIPLIEDFEWEQNYVKFLDAKKLLLKFFNQNDEGVIQFLNDKGNGWCFGERIYHSKNNINNYLYLPIKE